MTERSIWLDRTLVALADLPSGRADLELAVIVQVAIRFADDFEPDDRVYVGDRRVGTIW